MCNCKIVSRKGDVLIFKGTACGCLNVILPNVNIHLEPEGFGEFFAYIEIKLASAPKNADRIFVDTPCQGISLHFSHSQLSNLFDTLLDAKLKLELAEAFTEEG